MEGATTVDGQGAGVIPSGQKAGHGHIAGIDSKGAAARDGGVGTRRLHHSQDPDETKSLEDGCEVIAAGGEGAQCQV